MDILEKEGDYGTGKQEGKREIPEKIRGCRRMACRGDRGC